MDLVLVKNFPDITIAEMAQQKLEAEGIISILKGDSRMGIAGLGIGALPASMGIDLYVAEKDAERANAFLKHEYGTI